MERARPSKTPNFPRDRDGEIFENDLTEENDATPVEKEEGAEHYHGDPDTNSQAGDKFMTDRKFPK